MLIERQLAGIRQDKRGGSRDGLADGLSLEQRRRCHRISDSSFLHAEPAGPYDASTVDDCNACSRDVILRHTLSDRPAHCGSPFDRDRRAQTVKHTIDTSVCGILSRRLLYLYGGECESAEQERKRRLHFEAPVCGCVIGFKLGCLLALRNRRKAPSPKMPCETLLAPKFMS